MVAAEESSKSVGELESHVYAKEEARGAAVQPHCPSYLAFSPRVAQMSADEELRRGLSLLTNFGMSFSIVSFLTSITGSFGIAWFWGGPISMTWGWMVASFFTMIVALSMAEICSAYPTSGGLYYWAAALGNKRYGTMASWFAGWFNLLGQIAITAGVGMACTNSIVAMAVMYGSPARANRHGGISLASFSAFLPNSRGSPGPLLQAEPCPYDADYNLLTSAVMQTYITAGTYPTDAFGKNFTYAETAFNDAECARMPINFTQPQIYAIYVGVIFLVAVLNSASVKGLNGIVLFSIFWHVVGSLVIIIGLPSIVKVYQSRHMIWGYWQPFNQVDADGVTGFPQTLCTTASTKASIVASSEFASASYGPNNWMAGCPLYGTQAAPKGRTIFQTNLNGVFVANGAINWGYNGINKYSLGLKSGSKSTPEKDGPVNAYIWFCGLLMSQWCYTGYDASAHMSEETKNAAVNGPRGIITTIVATFAFGLSYIVSILASITDYNNSTGGPFALSYNPAAQIFWDAFETRYGNGRYSLGFWIIALGAQFLCTVSSLTSNSRMLYAFSRDDAVPGSSIWHVINKKVMIPVNAVWGMAVAALLIALPCIKSVEAFGAVTSIATIGLYISYVIPVVCRLANNAEFVPGPFSLGRAGIPIAVVAVLWVVVICIFFTMPNTFPIDFSLNFNYAIIAVGVVIVYATSTWLLPGPKPLNARVWFKGPNLSGLHTEIAPDGGPGASMRAGVTPDVYPIGV